MTRRNLLLASTLSSGGGAQEPEWPVYLTLAQDNGETGIKLYNYLMSILPGDTSIALPTTEYKIGDIIINGWGAVIMCRVLGTAKVIMMWNEDLIELGGTPSLHSNGFFA